MKIELPPIEASVHDYIVEKAGANLMMYKPCGKAWPRS